jgi:hypothetical protein
MNRAALWLAAAMLTAGAVTAAGPAYGQAASAPTQLPMTPEQLDFAIEIGAAVREQRLDDAARTLSAWESADATSGRPLSYQRAYWRGRSTWRVPNATRARRALNCFVPPSRPSKPR